jgi:hypothetical protein
MGCSCLTSRSGFIETAARKDLLLTSSAAAVLRENFKCIAIEPMPFVRIFRASCKTCHATAGFRQWVPHRIRDKRVPPGVT